MGEAGKTKSLGISNYSPSDYKELTETAKVLPSVNTFENNPMLYRKEWVDFFQENDRGIVLQAIATLWTNSHKRGGGCHCFATWQEPRPDLFALERAKGQRCCLQKQYALAHR